MQSLANGFGLCGASMTDRDAVRRVAAAGIASPPLAGIFIAQCGLLLLVSVCLMAFDMVVARSLGLGGAISLLPNAWFARQAFRYRGASRAALVVGSLYRAEALKFVITALMFAVVFAGVAPLSAPALFAGFVIMTVANGVGAWYMARQRVTRRP